VQRLDRSFNRFFHYVGTFALFQNANTLLIFGNVDQLKIVAESLDQNTLLLKTERIDRHFEFGVCPRIIAPPGFCQRTDMLDQRECIRPILIDDRVAQQPAQPMHIGAECCPAFVCVNGL